MLRRAPFVLISFAFIAFVTAGCSFLDTTNNTNGSCNGSGEKNSVTCVSAQTAGAKTSAASTASGQCDFSSPSPLLPVDKLSNVDAGPQVEVAQLCAAVTGNSTHPATAQEFLELYGQLDPLRIPDGDSLYILGTWDPHSRSFFLQKGEIAMGFNKVTFVRGEVFPDTDGRFHLSRKVWGQPGTFGEVQNYVMILTNPAQSRKLAAAAVGTFNSINSGLAPSPLNKYGTPIATFSVSTNPYYDSVGGGWTIIQPLFAELAEGAWHK